MKDLIYKGIKTNYKIDEYGNIFSFHIYKNGKLMKSRLDKDGYQKINLTINGKEKTCFVHRLVAENFVYNSDPKMNNIINHIDGNKNNNYYMNLEWTTAKGNTQHAVYHELFPVGERSKFATNTNDQIFEVCKMLQEQLPFSIISNETGVPVNVIKKIYSGKCWKSISRRFVFTKYYHDERKCKWSKYRDQIIDLINKGYKRNEIADIIGIYDKSFKVYIKIQRKNLHLKVQRLVERRTLK